jgi:asparaginyl-tRNA synthetase
MKKIMIVQSRIMSAARAFLVKGGLVEIVPPVIGPVTDPGIRGASHFHVDYYGKPYKVTSSMMFHKIAAASSLGGVFAFSPCVRGEIEETSATGRHLAEFWQIDVELAYKSYYHAMSLAEDLIAAIIRDVKKSCAQELESLGRKLEVPVTPFRKIPHKEAVKMATEIGAKAEYDKELPWEAEKAVSMKFKEPFFIIDYPTGSRGFYDRIDPTIPERLLDFDLMYPEGFGEAASGGEREYEYGIVTEKIIQAGLKPEDFGWYLEMLKEGLAKPTAGFGIGLERLTRYICGLEKIWEATPFPKVPGIFSP